MCWRRRASSRMNAAAESACIESTRKSSNSRGIGSRGSSRARDDGMTDVPQFFRMNLEVGDLAAAQRFYETLFGLQGRGQAGHRFYINPGPVALQIVAPPNPHPAPKALYFTVANLDAVHARASSL